MPFSRWLLGAMVAPTPSSALLHSATMVKAGVYLLIRLAPVMYGTYAGSMVSLVGGFTFLITSMLAITVSDGKAVLAYSTISNLGLIAACAGVGRQETVWAAVLLLIFHAVSKSLLFQTVGAIENATGSRDIESMHGLIARHPRLALTLSIGIAGMFLAPFGMLISKWAALKAFVDSGSIILVLFICFGSATTLFYWTKWVATVLSWNRKDTRQRNTTSGDQWTSLLIHSVLMVLLCFAFPAVSKLICSGLQGRNAPTRSLPQVISVGSGRLLCSSTMGRAADSSSFSSAWLTRQYCRTSSILRNSTAKGFCPRCLICRIFATAGGFAALAHR